MFIKGSLFKGKIAEIRIWNIARTQEQIKQDMNRSLSGDEANLIAYWKFDEGVENKVYDCHRCDLHCDYCCINCFG